MSIPTGKASAPGERNKEKKKPHFNAVNREHHRVLRDTGLEEKRQVSNHPGHTD